MNADERAEVAQQFGVAAEQVERDHLISHLLAFLSQNFGDRIQFIGGTALARTHLPDGRLSEDIDLIAIDDRRAVAGDLDAVLPRALARTHGRLAMDPPFSGVADTVAAVLRSATGMVVRIQLVSARGRVQWPTGRRPLRSAIAMRRRPNLSFLPCPPSLRPRQRHGPTVAHRETSGTYGHSTELGPSMLRLWSYIEDSVRLISLPAPMSPKRHRPRPNGSRNSPAKRGSPSTPPMPL